MIVAGTCQRCLAKRATVGSLVSGRLLQLCTACGRDVAAELTIPSGTARTPHRAIPKPRRVKPMRGQLMLPFEPFEK